MSIIDEIRFRFGSCVNHSYFLNFVRRPSGAWRMKWTRASLNWWPEFEWCLAKAERFGACCGKRNRAQRRIIKSPAVRNDNKIDVEALVRLTQRFLARSSTLSVLPFSSFIRVKFFFVDHTFFSLAFFTTQYLFYCNRTSFFWVRNPERTLPWVISKESNRICSLVFIDYCWRQSNTFKRTAKLLLFSTYFFLFFHSIYNALTAWLKNIILKKISLAIWCYTYSLSGYRKKKYDIFSHLYCTPVL